MNVKPGMSVQIDPAQAGKYLGVTMTVDSVARTNALLNVPGNVRKLKCPISLLIEPATGGEAALAARAYLAQVSAEPTLYPGTVFTLKNRPGLWVVLAQNASLKYRAAALGGDNGRYLSNIARSTMTVVEPSEIASALGMRA